LILAAHRKYFQTAGAVKGHLRSSAHSADRMACPGCARWFNGVGALAAHLETATQTCVVNRAQAFGNIVDMVTAGLVEVRTSRVDGSLRYVVSKNAREVFMAEAIKAEQARKKREEEAEIEAKVRERETYWQRNEAQIEW
jgi:hypothetical protein